jgi:hypothetical protein
VKLISLGLVFFLSLPCTGSSQIRSSELEKEYQISLRDFIELNLAILSAQISSGSYYFFDLPKPNFFTSIELSSDNTIRFEIDKKEFSAMTDSDLFEIIRGDIEFMRICIIDFMQKNFPDIEFDTTNGIIGSWNFDESSILMAKLEGGKIIYLRKKEFGK